MTFDPSSQVLVGLQRQIAIANMGVNEFVVERPRVSSNPFNVVSPGSLVAERLDGPDEVRVYQVQGGRWGCEKWG